MASNFFNDFKERHPIVLNAALIAITAVALFYIALLFIDVFTSHGQERRVPDVRFQSLEQAVAKLEAAGFKWDISDSTTYSEQFAPGMVIDQDPRAGSSIKAIRTVYLKMNALSPRRVALPKLKDISIRNGLATLRMMGFKNVSVDSVASPYPGLILQVLVNGKNTPQGTEVTLNSNIKLLVGDGSIDYLDPDSLFDKRTIDSIEQHNYEEEVKRYKQSHE